MATTSSEKVWRPECTGLGFTDEKFSIGKGKLRKVFHVHKAILLASGSPVFQQMLTEEFTAKTCFIKTDDNPKLFELLLNHLYGMHKKIKSLKSIGKLFTIGEKYRIPNILDIAKRYLESVEMSDDDFFDEIECKAFTHPLFLRKMLSYLKENTDSLIISERFLDVPEKIVDGILQMDKLNVDEYDLLVAVTEWAYQNWKNINSEKLMKFYKHIRFSNLTFDEYIKFIDTFPDALEAKSCLEIMKFLYFPYTRCLPEWCTPCEVSRKNQFHQEERELLFTCEPKDLLISQNIEMDGVYYDF